MMICNGQENQLKETFFGEVVKAMLSLPKTGPNFLEECWTHVLVELNKIFCSTNRYVNTAQAIIVRNNKKFTMVKFKKVKKSSQFKLHTLPWE